MLGCCVVACEDGFADRSGDFALEYCELWAQETCEARDGVVSIEEIQDCLGCAESCAP